MVDNVVSRIKELLERRNEVFEIKRVVFMEDGENLEEMLKSLHN